MSKSKYYDYDDDYDDDDRYNAKKMYKEDRRSIKNWKKAWDQHGPDYDEIDDFYNKYKK